MLIGVCGKAGSGKDTIADYLIKTKGFKKIALADPIKRLVKDVFVLDDHTVYDRVAREQPLKNFPNWSVRKLLQFIGTELFREQLDDSIWVKSLWYRIQQDKDNNYVVSDIRFPNELNFFRDNAKSDFVSIKVIRNGCDGNVGLEVHPLKKFFLKLIGKDHRHASEKYDLNAEITIENNGTFEELYAKVDAEIGTENFKDHIENNRTKRLMEILGNKSWRKNG